MKTTVITILILAGLIVAIRGFNWLRCLYLDWKLKRKIQELADLGQELDKRSVEILGQKNFDTLKSKLEQAK